MQFIISSRHSGHSTENAKKMILKRKKLCLILTFFSISAILIITTNTINSTWNRKTVKESVEKSVEESVEKSVEESVDECMKNTNLHYQSILSDAKRNARYIFDEFRKVIPKNSLRGYISHCWNEYYFTQWSERRNCSGKIGNISFSRYLNKYNPYNHILSYLNAKFPRKWYESNLVCIPKVFLPGFPKCGSTFLYDFINALISKSKNLSNLDRIQVCKETQFWVCFHALLEENIYVPSVNDLGAHLLNYIPGIHKMSSFNTKDSILVDGTPNYIYEWPVFRKSEHNMTNYCLLPSVLPKLIPNSKFIVIMRNPVDMLYSAFWYFCINMNHVKIRAVQGPDIFHERVTSKLLMFNNCMNENSTIPGEYTMFNRECLLNSKNYSSCIQNRIHFLDKCLARIIPEIFTPKMPKCMYDNMVHIAVYFAHIRKWLSVVPRDRFLFLKFEELVNNPSQGALSVLKFLNLDTKVASNEQVIEGIVSSCSKNPQVGINYRDDPQLQMRKDTRTMLENFYHPFNSLLAQLLDDDKYLWS